MNWVKCSKCKTIHSEKIYFLNRPNSNNGNYYFYCYYLFDKLKCKKCKQTVGSIPHLIPPTWNKTYYHKNITNVWKQAANELSDAKNIFIIGYSFPPNDMFFKYLYALGTIGKKRIKNFVVINPDNSIEQRFKDLIGQDTLSIFEFKPVIFNKSFGFIEKILNLNENSSDIAVVKGRKYPSYMDGF